MENTMEAAQQVSTFDIKATPFEDGKVITTIDQIDTIDGEKQVDNLMTDLLDTAEEQTKAALIALGWTPPGEKSPVVADAAMLTNAIIGRGFLNKHHKKNMIAYGYANQDGWIREALIGKKVHALLALYTKQ